MTIKYTSASKCDIHIINRIGPDPKEMLLCNTYLDVRVKRAHRHKTLTERRTDISSKSAAEDKNGVSSSPLLKSLQHFNSFLVVAEKLH